MSIDEQTAPDLRCTAAAHNELIVRLEKPNRKLARTRSTLDTKVLIKASLCIAAMNHHAQNYAGQVCGQIMMHDARMIKLIGWIATSDFRTV